jgi:Secretion system C-terminal sorting domain
MKKDLLLLLFIFLIVKISDAQTYFPLTGVAGSVGGIFIDWSNPNLIANHNDWSNVPFMKGFSGNGLTLSLDVNPRTVTTDGTTTSSNILANQTNPNTLNADGFAEFEFFSNPTIAMRASNTASAPFLMFYISTLTVPPDFFPGISFTLIDIDNTANNAVQKISVQYRIGETGLFTPITPESFTTINSNLDYFRGYNADVSYGPFLSGHRSRCEYMFPFALLYQPKVQIRIVSTNASGGNEWIGIDDIGLGGAGLLPIRYSDFTSTLKNNSILLNWKATTDSPEEYFDIEKSTDGTNFKKLTAVLSKGIGDFNYVYLDNNLVEGTNFYRLKLVNKDGAFKYTNIEKVVYLGKNISQINLYPKVSFSNISLEIISSKKAECALQITNSLGGIVQKSRVNLIFGENKLPIDINNLSAGIYFIRINVNGESFTESFLKQ